MCTLAFLAAEEITHRANAFWLNKTQVHYTIRQNTV